MSGAHGALTVRTKTRLSFIYKPLDDLLFAERLIRHRGDITLAPGPEFILFGGRVPGRAILCVHTKHGRFVLASDAVRLFKEIDKE